MDNARFGEFYHMHWGHEESFPWPIAAIHIANNNIQSRLIPLRRALSHKAGTYALFFLIISATFVT